MIMEGVVNYIRLLVIAGCSSNSKTDKGKMKNSSEKMILRF